MLVALFALTICAPPAHAAGNGLIAYTNLIDKGSPSARRAVFSYPGGQLTHPLTGDNDSGPAWSPDGQSLAFIRYSGTAGGYLILVADADGANPRVIGGQRFPDGSPTLLNGLRPITLTWSPDSKIVGIGAVCTGGSTCFRALTLSANGTVSAYGGFSSFAINSQGFDWGADGLAAQCFIFNLPPELNNLFCVYKNGLNYINAIARDANPPVTQGTSLFSVPRWKYDSRGRRVLFLHSYGLPVASGSVFVTGLFSMKPSTSEGSYLATDLKAHTLDPGIVTCTNKVGGVSVTTHKPQHTYSQPFPSPDGKYIAVKRVTADPVTDPETKVCIFKNIDTGIYVLRDTGAVQNIAALGDDVAEPAWQQSPANVTVVMDDGHGNELRGLKVKLFGLDDEQPLDITPDNPTAGQYQFKNVPAGDYRVRATLTDADGDAFEIRHEYPSSAAVSADFELRITPDLEHVERHFSFSAEQAGFLTANIADSGHWDRLDDMATIYYQMRRFVDWVKAELTPNTGASVPFYTFATSYDEGTLEADEFFYFSTTNAIYMGTEKSAYESRDDASDQAPVNGEWHEFAHHLDAINRHEGLSCPGEPNHYGYQNASTCDSLDEGVASFLPNMLARDPDYAGIVNLEFHTKAWGFRILSDPNQANMEDLAVAALLWDLVDETADSEYTLAIGANGLHLPVTYTDTVSVPLRDVWTILGTAKPLTVRELQQGLDARTTALTVDIDSDTVMDVNVYDPLFIMHGFFPIAPDQSISDAHTTYHYGITIAREAGREANESVGRSDHFGFTWGDYTSPTWIPRSNTPVAEGANLDIQVRDASGTPLEGADLTVTIHYPDSDQPMLRRLGKGDSNLVHLELPLYFDYIPEGSGLPACAPATDLYVSVTVSASINGYVSGDLPTFDNCAYAQAILAASGPAALSYTLEFPEDSSAPVTTLQTYGAGQVSGTNATESWTLELLCNDPEVGGFASGCTRSEYILDGSPVTRYGEPVTITETGQHVFEYRSADAAANEEAFRSVTLSIGPPAATITGFTPPSGPLGTSVAITGTNFNGTSLVTFNGVSASHTVVSDTELTATVPTGATTGPITVTNPSGTTTSSLSFVVIPPPTIAGFSPAVGNVGSLVTITGSNLGGATRVTFNGVSASYTVNSPTQATAIVPTAATTGPVAIATPGGTSTSVSSFVVTFGPPPSITSFSPANGKVGTAVTLKGANLSGVSAVTFNGTSATFKLKGASVSTTVPPGATTGPIEVTTPGGRAASATSFVVVASPTIADFTPASGAVGTVVTLTGTNFTGATSVKFGGANASFTVVSTTTITATEPKSAKSGPISVVTPGGTATSAASFTVTR